MLLFGPLSDSCERERASRMARRQPLSGVSREHTGPSAGACSGGRLSTDQVGTGRRGRGRGCNALLREMAVEPMVCDSLTQILRTEGSKCPLEEWALGGGKNRRVSCCDVRAGSSSRAAGGGGTRLGAGRRA